MARATFSCGHYRVVYDGDDVHAYEVCNDCVAIRRVESVSTRQPIILQTVTVDTPREDGSHELVFRIVREAVGYSVVGGEREDFLMYGVKEDDHAICTGMMHIAHFLRERFQTTDGI